jgi:hypothetical protein
MKYLLPFLFIISLLLAQGISSAPASDLSDFTSDGCSLFPDGSIKDPGKWCDCCFQHDIAYWKGGAEEERKQADEELRECVFKRTGNKALARFMFDGVRAGGQPVFPTWYRWGYGWKYGRGYAPLTQKERQQITRKLDLYFKDHPQGYCRKAKK